MGKSRQDAAPTIGTHFAVDGDTHYAVFFVLINFHGSALSLSFSGEAGPLARQGADPNPLNLKPVLPFGLN